MSGRDTMASAMAGNSKMDAISVTDFGAKGDGITDDSAAINNAIAATPTGGILVVPPGNYLISENSLSITKSITIKGYHNSVIVAGSGRANLYMIDVNASGVTLDGFVVDGNSICNIGLQFEVGCAHIEVKGIEIRNIEEPKDGTALPFALYIRGLCNDFDISNCYFHDISNSNTDSDGTCRAIMLSDNDENGVYYNINIHDNIFQNITPFSNGDAVSVQDIVNPPVSSDIKITNNHFINCQKRAVKVNGVNGVLVLGNTIDNLTNQGGTNKSYAAISIYGDNCIVQANVVHGGTYYQGIEVGIASATYRNVKILDNIIEFDPGATNSGSDAIRLYRTLNDVLVRGNSTHYGRYGIHLNCQGTNLQIDQNTIANTSLHGIEFDGNSGVFPISGYINNTIFDNVNDNGIDFNSRSAPSGFSFLNNRGTTGWGVYESPIKTILDGAVSSVGGVTTAGNYGIATVIGTVVNSLLTTSAAKSILSVAPSVTGLYRVDVSLTVIVTSTICTIAVTYKDSNSTSQTLILLKTTSENAGSHVFSGLINAQTGTNIVVTVTAGTANQVYVNAVIMAI